MNPMGHAHLTHEQAIVTKGSAVRKIAKRSFVLVLILLLAAFLAFSFPSQAVPAPDTTKQTSKESSAAPLSVETVTTEADLDQALADPAVTEIKVDANLILTSAFAGQVNGTKTLTSNGGVKTLTRGDDNDGALFTISGAGNSTVTIKNLTIKGASAPAAQPGSLIVVSSGATLLLETGATLTGNQATDSSGEGGAIFSAGTVTVGKGSLISDNAVVSGASAYGGAIFGAAGSTLTLAGGAIQDNLVQSGTASGNVAYGGGICSEGTVHATAGSIEGNTAQGANAQGGGIYLRSTASGEIGAISISDNAASQGGGAYVERSVVFAGTKLARNEARAYDDHFNRGCGGGIFATGKSTVVLQDVTVSQNTAAMYASAPTSETGLGGGFFADGNVTVVLSGLTRIEQNKAADGAGGFVYTAGALEIKAHNGSAPVVSRNTAVGPPGSVEHGRGGGLAIWGSINASAGSIRENSASNAGGGIDLSATANLGAVTISGNSAQFGGGISNNTGSTLACVGTTITKNTGLIGGGIVNRGTVNFSKTCQLSGNIAQEASESNNIINRWESGLDQPVLRAKDALVANGGVLLAVNPKSDAHNNPLLVTGPLVGTALVVEGYGQYATGLSVSLNVGDVVARGENYQITQADLAALRLSENWTGYTLALEGNDVVVTKGAAPNPPVPDPDPTPPAPDPTPTPTPGPSPETGDPLVATAGFVGALAVAGAANALISRRRPEGK